MPPTGMTAKLTSSCIHPVGHKKGLGFRVLGLGAYRVLQPKNLKVNLTSCEVQDFELGVEIGGHNKPISGDPTAPSKYL